MATAMPHHDTCSDAAQQLFDEITRMEDTALISRPATCAVPPDLCRVDALSDNLCARMFDDPLAWCEELLASDAPLTLPDVTPAPRVDSAVAARSPCSSDSPDIKDGSDRRLSYRQRQRHEIIALRETVAKMEAELERLRNVRCSSHHTRAESSEAMTHEQRLILAVEDYWRRAATRERLGRQRAVQEQERLRHIVEQNIKVVKTLERLLEQQIQTEIAGQAMTRSLYLERLGLLQEGYTRGIYAFLSRGLARSAQMTCDVLTRAGMAQRLGTYEHMQIHPGASPADWFIEYKGSRFLPFSAQRVSDLSWRCMTMPTSRVLANGAFQVDELSQDEVKIKFVLEIPFQRSVVSTKGWVVGRRCMPTSTPPMGFISAWSDFLIVEGLTPEPLELREDGWSQLRKLPSDDACVLQEYSRVRSVLSSNAHIPPHMGSDRVWQVIQAMFSEFVTVWNEHWERMLLASSSSPSSSV